MIHTQHTDANRAKFSNVVTKALHDINELQLNVERQFLFMVRPRGCGGVG